MESEINLVTAFCFRASVDEPEGALAAPIMTGLWTGTDAPGPPRPERCPGLLVMRRSGVRFPKAAPARKPSS